MTLTEAALGLDAPINDALGQEVTNIADLEEGDSGILLVDRLERGRITNQERYIGRIASFGANVDSEKNDFVFIGEKGTMHFGVTLGEKPIPGNEQTSARYYRHLQPVAPIGTLVTRFFRFK